MPGTVIGTGKGTVKFFNQQKGFGFVVREDGGEDVFVHISAVEAAGLTGLAEGQPLEFTLSERNGRVSAIELKIEGEPLPIEERPAGRFGDRDRGGPAGGGGGHPRQAPGERVEGTVKRSEEHTSELQSLMRTSYAVFCWKKNIRPIMKLKRLIAT